MNKIPSRVCLVIPALNEAETVGRVVADLQTTLANTNFEYEIIVVDDGSKDKTAEEAKNAGAHVISHILNAGSGGATATGLSYAQQNGFSIAATLDADGQHLAKDVIKGIEKIQKGKYDLLIGSRLIDSTGMSRVKRLGNSSLTLITFLLFGVRITDSQSGLRIFSRRALNELKWKTAGYEFCSEMLWRAKQLGLNISEYPIQAVYTDYSLKKGQNNWNGYNIVKSLFKQRIMELFGE